MSTTSKLEKKTFVAGGMILTDVAVRPSHGSWIVTPDCCADEAWRIVLSSHDTQAEAEAEAERLRGTR